MTFTSCLEPGFEGARIGAILLDGQPLNELHVLPEKIRINFHEHQFDEPATREDYYDKKYFIAGFIESSDMIFHTLFQIRDTVRYDVEVYSLDRSYLFSSNAINLNIIEKNVSIKEPITLTMEDIYGFMIYINDAGEQKARNRFEDLGYSLRDKSSVLIGDYEYQWLDHPNGEGRYIYVFHDFKISYGIGAVQQYKLHEMDKNENIIDLSK